MESIRNGLYALAIALVASTIIFSVSLTAAAGTIGTGLAKGGTGVMVASATPAPAVPTTVSAVAPKPSGKISLADGNSKGPDSAKIALVEYSDFQCPFCGRFYTDTEGQILKTYVDTGKVKFIYKDFPLDSIHPNARPAAIAYECAVQQDSAKGWAMHDLMFANQEQLSDASYAKWAAQVGLDTTKFGTCYSTKASEPVVNAQFTEGASVGVQGTPAFYVTDSQGNIVDSISGAQPFSAFKASLDKALAA